MEKRIRKSGPGQHKGPGKLVALFLVLTIAGCSTLRPHPRAWTKAEKAVAGFFIAGHLADAYTTERHQDHPERFCERNPVLGRHPDDSRIVVYFSLTGLVVLGVAHLYPELRFPLLGVCGTANSWCALHNYRMMRDWDK